MLHNTNTNYLGSKFQVAFEEDTHTVNVWSGLDLVSNLMSAWIEMKESKSEMFRLCGLWNRRQSFHPIIEIDNINLKPKYFGCWEMLWHLKRAALIGQLHIAIALAHVTWVIRFMIGCTIQPLCRLEEDWMKRRREEEERRRWGGGEEELHSKFLGHCYRDKNINERCRLWHMEIVVPKGRTRKKIISNCFARYFPG